MARPAIDPRLNRKGEWPGPEIVLRPSEALWHKLQAVATQRKTTIERVIIDLLESVQPGGSGWQHPTKGKKLS